MKKEKNLNSQKFKRHHRELSAIKTRIRMHGLNLKTITRWTIEEDNILKMYFPIEGLDCIKRLPMHNTEAAIKNRVQYLKIGGSGVSRLPWTDEEIELLKKYYPLMGQDCIKFLPNRTKINLACKAIRLGLEKKVFEWTDEWIKIFKEFYPVEGFKVKNRFPNCRDTNCRQLAKKLGMKVYKNGVAPVSVKRKAKYTNIRCVETGEEFYLISDAARKYNLSKSGITYCITGKTKSHGILPDRTKLHWELINKKDKDK